MKLPEDQVIWVAKLAQIELTDEEKARYAEDLSNTLTYIDELATVDVSALATGIADNSQITGLTNVAAVDVVHSSRVTREEFLQRAPDSTGGYIRVKKVLDK